jgi:hypothetical protein
MLARQADRRIRTAGLSVIAEQGRKPHLRRQRDRAHAATDTAVISRPTASKRRAILIVFIFAPAGSVAVGRRAAAGPPRLVSSDAASVHARDCDGRIGVVGISSNPRLSSAWPAPSAPREVSAIEAAA